MSVTALGMALDVRGLSPRAKLVFIALCNCANEYTFLGYPSRKDLAGAADCSVDTVDRCLREISDVGLIEKQERDRDDGKGQTSNLYRVFPAHDPSRRNAAPRENGAAEMRPGGTAEMRRPQPQSYAAPPAAHGAAPKEPLNEPLSSYHLSARGNVTKQGFEALIARAGDACNPTHADLHHGADLNRFLRGGCDWESDILPAVDKLAASFRARGKRFSTWSLLEEHAVQNRDRRLAGLQPSLASAVTSHAPRSSKPSMASVIKRMEAEGKLP